MPIYEFRCDSCENKFDKLCRMSDSDGVVCPACGGKASKLFSTFYSASSSSDGSHSSGQNCSGCTSCNCSSCH